MGNIKFFADMSTPMPQRIGSGTHTTRPPEHLYRVLARVTAFGLLFSQWSPARENHTTCVKQSAGAASRLTDGEHDRFGIAQSLPFLDDFLYKRWIRGLDAHETSFSSFPDLITIFRFVALEISSPRAFSRSRFPTIQLKNWLSKVIIQRSTTEVVFPDAVSLIFQVLWELGNNILKLLQSRMKIEKVLPRYT